MVSQTKKKWETNSHKNAHLDPFFTQKCAPMFTEHISATFYLLYFKGSTFEEAYLAINN